MLDSMTDQIRKMINPAKDVLILVDVQNDFLPGGALAVPDGDRILPVIEAIAPIFSNIVLTQDWHPAGHSSFASAHPGKNPFETCEASYGTQVLWPDHCVIGSEGARLRVDPYTRHRAQMVVRKGFRPDVDSYSAFLENDKKTLTGLSGYMRDRGLERAFFAGLATDFCVGFSAIDARRMGFGAVLLDQASRGISSEGVEARKAEMRDAGVQILE